MEVRSTAPGTPRILTNRIVNKLRPMWKLKNPPIKLIKRIIRAPKREFRSNFSINFNGTIKILHKTNMIQSPEIYVKTLISSNF